MTVTLKRWARLTLYLIFLNYYLGSVYLTDFSWPGLFFFFPSFLFFFFFSFHCSQIFQIWSFQDLPFLLRLYMLPNSPTLAKMSLFIRAISSESESGTLQPPLYWQRSVMLCPFSSISLFILKFSWVPLFRFKNVRGTIQEFKHWRIPLLTQNLSFFLIVF